MISGELPAPPISKTLDFILVASADAGLTGSDGKLYAHGSTTFFIYDPR